MFLIVFILLITEINTIKTIYLIIKNIYLIKNKRNKKKGPRR